ncbi:MAG: HD domain-containing protein [Acidobacteria bacterium]|nr:HD domain-containing protein [Acidobacteriota bacterium]
MDTAKANKTNGLSKLLEAASFAAKRHAGQKRKGSDAEPYINHLLDVVDLLVNVGGVEDYDVLIAAMLHDTAEDTDTTFEEIGEKFGREVSSYVAEVTDDQSLPKQRRKDLQIEHAPHLSPGAKLIKLADKISNIRDVTENPPDGWSIERRREYVEWGEKVGAGLRGSNADLEREFNRVCSMALKAATT